MMPFEVRRFASRSGQELAILLDRVGGPLFWPNVFATSEYRKRPRSVNTCTKVLRALGMAWMWASAHGRDLDHELRQGEFLTLNDVESLADFLSLSAADQVLDATLAKAPAKSASKVVRLEDARPDHRVLANPKQRASNPIEIAARIRWVALYIKWHFDQRLGSLNRRRKETADLKALGEAVVARLRQRARGGTNNAEDEEALEGVPREVLERIEQALVPDSPSNPFKSRFVQVRNYLIWRLYVDTGARRNEVREAKADDIEYATRRFHIRVSKTHPRRVPIGATAAEAFDHFMEEHWSRLPQAARRRGYLFTDENGRHLSTRAFNRIFEGVREHVSGVPDFMSPHTVRRSWNDAFSERVDACPPEKRPSEKEEVDMRNRLQGWSGRSSMGARYGKRHIRRKSDEIAEGMTDRLSANKECFPNA